MSRTVSGGQSSNEESFSSDGSGSGSTTWHVVAESCEVYEAAEAAGPVVATLGLGARLVVDERRSVKAPTSVGSSSSSGTTSSSSSPTTSNSGGSSSSAAAARRFEQYRGLRWLRVKEPVVGWILASNCAAGDMGQLGWSWRFVVVCRDGAFVREGLELASAHLYTLQKNAVFVVHERRVNEQGLTRLRTDDGWISEDLNPLSGQRGPIVVPLPVAEALEYRVVLDDGAVVRETVELSSAIVQVVPRGDRVVVDDKQFSDHPQLHCVPRLRLVAPVRGWISQRLNREPPDDLAVVELVGLADRALTDRGARGPNDGTTSSSPPPQRARSGGLSTTMTPREGGLLSTTTTTPRRGAGAPASLASSSSSLTTTTTTTTTRTRQQRQQLRTPPPPPRSEARTTFATSANSSSSPTSTTTTTQGRPTSEATRRRPRRPFDDDRDDDDDDENPGAPHLREEEEEENDQEDDDDDDETQSRDGSVSSPSLFLDSASERSTRAPQAQAPADDAPRASEDTRVEDDGPAGSGDTLCVVCLSAPRNASFIHGETGHIACCLRCARALKARGDTCPVCRMTIERVIQHFWA
eukprot:CAMPEP_0118899848 /NCGR_PEP_ID=MMETSP1166-20130328/6224_1 /TAXON_ID=1104430 /ORGANISM="Chrysoreinhardia sp, Strain CCMP3193" /LENGTH=580 /DNA_ID=CAMNT_0006838979 /DNA_START=106 /DNA_END=1848 /DNA_ORIENTATION=+